MKVLLNPLKCVDTNANVKSKRVSNVKLENINSFNQISHNYDNAIKNYQINNINFKNRSYVSETNQRLLKELENLRLEKKSLLEKVTDTVVQDAKAKLEKLKDWFDSESYYSGDNIKSRAVELAKKAGEQAKAAYREQHGSVYRFFAGNGKKQYDAAYDMTMNTYYWDDYYIVNDIKNKKSLYEAIVNNSNKTEEQKKKRLEEIEVSIRTTQQLINYQGLQDSVNNMLASHGGVNDRIAGYEKEKEEIKAKFIDLLAKSKDDESIEVPGAIILYGPTGTGKTTFLKGIQEQSKEYATVIKVPSMSTQGLMKTIVHHLEDARQRYNREGKRTILLMDDVEKYFAIKEQDAKILGVELDDFDKSMLQAYGNNYGFISEFKQLLDTIAKVPDKADSSVTKAATTIFVTTNYPHLIHPDLLSREGKATKIAIGLASDENLAKVMRHHFKNMESVAETIRSLKDKPDGESFLNSIAGVTEKGRTTLKQMLKDGTIDQINVDYMNMPYKNLTSKMGPNVKEGAYSNDTIYQMIKGAFLDYLEQANEGGDFKDSFFKIYRNTKRDISPERLKKFNLIDRMIKGTEIDVETLEELLNQRDMGLLSKKKENLLQYHLIKIQSELQSLRDYETAGEISEEQILRKKELEILENKILEKEKASKIDDIECDFE